jgi:hypothetical protein
MLPLVVQSAIVAATRTHVHLEPAIGRMHSFAPKSNRIVQQKLQLSIKISSIIHFGKNVFGGSAPNMDNSYPSNRFELGRIELMRWVRRTKRSGGARGLDHDSASAADAASLIAVLEPIADQVRSRGAAAQCEADVGASERVLTDALKRTGWTAG